MTKNLKSHKVISDSQEQIELKCYWFVTNPDAIDLSNNEE